MRIAWGVLVNLAQLAVVVAALCSGAQGFETKVLAALALIYGAVRLALTTLDRAAAAVELRVGRQFVTLLRLMNHQNAAGETQRLEEAERDFGKATARFVTDAAFHYMTLGLALWFLLSQLYRS